jgi:DNA-binding response OmpR family regulator
MRILIVEDDARLGLLLKRFLSEHYRKLQWVQTCREADDALSEARFDLVLLDLGLPDGDGLGLLEDWRTAGFIGLVLILSGRDSLQDRVRGLDAGADGYLAKPCSLEELHAKMRALLRRQSLFSPRILERGGVRLDQAGRIVHAAGKPLSLTAREYELLELFMQNAGRVVTRSRIAEQIWATNREVADNLLDVYMRRLRNKLESTLGRPTFKTVRGVGYQML